MARKGGRKGIKWADIANSSVGRMNASKAAAILTDKGGKANKFRAVKVEIDGISFDSIGEGNRYVQLLGFVRDGDIKDLRLQVKYELTPSYKNDAGKAVRASHYIADFVYFNIKENREVVEDFKGKRTQGYIDKAKQMAIKHKIEIYETSVKHIKEWRL